MSKTADMLTDPNDIARKNLGYYRRNAAIYIEETKNNNMHAILEQFLHFVQDAGHILDLGCGSGRDSHFFIERGYHVTATDASCEIAELASTFLGQKVMVQLAQEINETKEYDGVWACASLLHVPKAEIFDTFARITTSLKPGGIWYMSFKHETGERWDERGRFFNCYSKQSMTQLINQFSEIKIISISVTGSGLTI